MVTEGSDRRDCLSGGREEQGGLLSGAAHVVLRDLSVAAPPKHRQALGPLAYAPLWGEVILPFIQEMWGAGQAAGRQRRVAASPSSSTWSLSLMWKTGGKSAGRADSHGS